MPKSTTFSNNLLALTFNGTAITGLAQNAASPATGLYLGLHTASPGLGGDQTTNETAYSNYTRAEVERTTGGWSVPSGGSTSNVELVQFPQCGASGATLTHVSIGTDFSGTGKVLYQGALSSSLAVSNGIQPQFAANALTITEA